MEFPRKKHNGFEVGLMSQDEAIGVVELYRAVYGDSYPIKSMYDPEYIFEQQETGHMYRTVVVDSAGQVAAHQAIFRTSAPWDQIYEEGHGMVLPEYRGKGLNNLTMEYDHGVVIPRCGIPEIWGEAVANHIFMQKTCITCGWYETGLELDLMPASSYAKSGASSGRVSSVLVFKTFIDDTQPLLVPDCYHDMIQDICQRAGKSRQIIQTAASSFSGKDSVINMEFYDQAGVARLTIFEAGSDFTARFAEQEQEMDRLGAGVRQVYLPLNREDTSLITDVLRSRGYFFAGLMPRWFNHDGLMMQKLSAEPNLQDLNLYTDFSKKLLRFILADRSAEVTKHSLDS